LAFKAITWAGSAPSKNPNVLKIQNR